LLDSVQAITDASYFDWPILPEAPSSLDVHLASGSARLNWEVHGDDGTGIVVERRNRNGEAWTKLSELPAGSKSFTDPQSTASGQLAYRVYALNKAGRSAYSNIARVTP
jgi:hypothetical protein